MQPPLPRKPAPEVTRGDDPRSVASTRHPLAPADTAIDNPVGADAHLVGTRDPSLVQAWAEYHGAEPGTGEATASGPATIAVNDQGSGLRFNFPGASRFRTLTWDEWMAHFHEAQLVFVFEIDRPDSEGMTQRFGGAFYRLVSTGDWGDRPLATRTVHDDAPHANDA